MVLSSTWDVLQLHGWCLADPVGCRLADFAPILKSGSSCVNMTLLPISVAMPMAVWPHTTCFDKWQPGAVTSAVTGNAQTVCPDLLPGTVPSLDSAGLGFGPNLGVRPDNAAAG